MPHKSTENSDFDTVDAPEMVVYHRRKRSASPSLPHRPPIDCNRSAKKWKSNYYSGDTISIWTGEGEARTHNNDPSPVPSPPPVDSRSAGRNQQAQTGILPISISISISTRAEKPHKRKLEVLIDLPHKPKPEPDFPAAKRRSLTLMKKIQSKFPRPKSVWQSVSVGWNFGGPPS